MVDDTLLAFDEFPVRGLGQKSTRRKMLGATVLHAGVIRRPTYRFTFSDGTVLRSSAEHQWLVSKKKGHLQKWRTTEKIAQDVAAGKQVRMLRFVKPWEEERSYEAGYVSGLLDGEGCLHFRKIGSKGAGAFNLTFAQKKGIVLSTFDDILTARGIKHRIFESSGSSARQLAFVGEWTDRARTLGTFRPKRLLEKFSERVMSCQFRMDIHTRREGVVTTIADVTYEGSRNVVALETTSKTYFAEGFGAHNCSMELMLSGSPRPGHGYVRSDVEVSKLSKETVKRLGLYNIEDTAVIGRYIRAKCTKTKMSTTLDTTADFYIDFRKGIHLWEGLAERLIAEGLLRVDKDASADFEMDTLDRETGEVTTLKFKTRKDWLNHVAANPTILGLRGG